MKPVTGVIAFIVIIAVLLAAVVYGLGGFQRLTAGFRGETSQIEKTKADGDYRIAAYDEFFSKCSAIQAAEDSIANQIAEREYASPERKHQIDANVTATRNQRAQLIREYNADATREATAGQFRDSNLPYQIDIDEETTECAS